MSRRTLRAVRPVLAVFDSSPGDPAGNFTIGESSISKNAAAVLDPSTTFTATTKGDS